MKRYRQESEGVMHVIDTGEWVKYADAQAEIDHAVQREREEIVDCIEKWNSSNTDYRMFAEVMNQIRARGGPPAHKPGNIERMSRHDHYPYQWLDKLNELVDAVNEMKIAIDNSLPL